MMGYEAPYHPLNINTPRHFPLNQSLLRQSLLAQ